MIKPKTIKAWAVIAKDGVIIEIRHGNAKEKVIGYDICISRKEAQKCKKLHCDRDNYFKVVPVQIKLLTPNPK